ncbi:transposase [Companilactobacillus sp. HBUAS59544]|uniref:transposase n=1 Tax=Companilactobacillus sp. HBUAS59544 TaxID=3109363 RepID=UPI003FA5F70E
MLNPNHKLFASFPGVKPVYAAGFLGEVGKIARFNNDSQLSSYSKKNRTATYYLKEIINTLAQTDPVFKNDFEQKLTAKANTTKNRALSQLHSKMIRIIYLLITTNRLYVTEFHPKK